MSNPAELALVIKALACGVGGCVHWHPKSEAQVRHAMSRFGLTPEGIKDEAIQFVQAGGRVDWYRIIVPMPDVFVKGLFVEIELFDDDEDFPEVLLVQAHEQH